MEIKYNHNYYFTFLSTFGDLPNEKIKEILKDGRLASHFLERQLEIDFPELTFVNAKGYDHIRKDSNILYDQKCFTQGGLVLHGLQLAGFLIDAENRNRVMPAVGSVKKLPA